MTHRTVLGAVIVLAVGGAIAGGFVVAGSPQEARFHRLDARRVSDLQRIQTAIDVSFTRSRTMPESIEAAIKTQAGGAAPVDPATGAPYEYRIVDGPSFELCAMFDRASTPQGFAPDEVWAHGAGRQCFPLVARDLNNR